MRSRTNNNFPLHEQRWIFWAMIFVGGFFGAYTFSVRGGVFCNAQTANVVLFTMSLGTGNWQKALYLLLPMSAYLSGAALSEFLTHRLSKNRYIQWSAALIGFEILTVLFLGLLPKSAPDQICQVALNFICSMQFHAFHDNEGTPMATIFVTNHIKETGSNFVKAIVDKDAHARATWKAHAAMIGLFMLGCLTSTVLCTYFDVRAIFGTLPVLLYVLIRLIVKTSSHTS